MNKRILIGLVILAVVFASVFLFFDKGDETAGSGNQEVNPGITSQNETPNSTSGIEPVIYNIDIKDFNFNVSELTINIGDKVTWTNKDSSTHTVTSDSGGEISSLYLANTQSYTHKFTSVGTFAYHCKLHPMMKGKVIVK